MHASMARKTDLTPFLTRNPQLAGGGVDIGRGLHGEAVAPWVISRPDRGGRLLLREAIRSV
jgi:hypothetical protein